MKKTFFQNTDRVLYRTLVFWLFYFCRQNNGVIMFCPLSIVFVEIWLNPILVGDNSLLTVVAYDDGRYAPEIFQSKKSTQESNYTIVMWA